MDVQDYITEFRVQYPKMPMWDFYVNNPTNATDFEAYLGSWLTPLSLMESKQNTVKYKGVEWTQYLGFRRAHSISAVFVHIETGTHIFTIDEWLDNTPPTFLDETSSIRECLAKVASVYTAQPLHSNPPKTALVT